MEFAEAKITTRGEMLGPLYHAVSDFCRNRFPIDTTVMTKETRQTVREHLNVFNEHWTKLVARYTAEPSVPSHHPMLSEWQRLSAALGEEEVVMTLRIFPLKWLTEYRDSMGQPLELSGFSLDVLMEVGIVTASEPCEDCDEEHVEAGAEAEG